MSEMGMRNTLKAMLKTSPYSLYCWYERFRLKKHSEGVIRRYLGDSSVRKLHIGCGGTTLEGWLNSDLAPDSRGIAYLDASQKFPLPDCSFDYVYSEHLFEHLKFAEQLNYLKEVHRILKPGGKIRIATPNFDFLIHLADPQRSELESRYLRWNFDIFLKKLGEVFRDEANLEVYVVNNYLRDWGHQLVHNAKSLESLVSFSGFTHICQPTVSTSEDGALANLEHHGAMITDEFNRLETIVIEAAKF